MEKIPRLSPEQRSNLVAYLDGELPEQAAKEIEQVLAKSPAVQHDVEMLSRTWDLLDELPRLAGAADFSARTMSIVQKAEAPRPFLPPSLVARFRGERLRRAAIGGTWVAGLMLAAAAGFFVTYRLVPDGSDELLRNLPVIEKLDEYSNVESIEFLKQLETRIGSFDDSGAPKR